MRTTISVILAAVMATVVLLPGCISFRRNNNDKTIVELVEHMKSCGLRVDSAAPALFDAIMAQDGVSVKIDGQDIQLFKYDTKIKRQKEKLDKIYESGTITILGIDFYAKTNGSFIMLNYKGHPDEEKLLEFFSSF